jgi:arylsulfatase A-like enzyme
MNRFKLTIILLVCLGATSPLIGDVPRPNIVIILADDLGYGDVACYNRERGKIPTPHIDKLASQGMRFTDGHSSSGVCSPSRYTLLTGRYHWRTRLQNGIVPVFGAPLIAPDRLTIAGLAKQQGYRTACIGKWHLGWDWPKSKGNDIDFAQPIAGGPTTRGFDEYFGTDVPNWPPFCFIENDRTRGIPTAQWPKKLIGNNFASLPGPAVPDWKLAKILPEIADRACAFIANAAKEKAPFLLYLPLTSPHTPLAVNAEWQGKSGLNRYADFVMETDAMVGRVLQSLEDSSIAQNTLVLLTSDNGCAAYIGVQELERKGHFPSGPLHGYKASVFEGGHRVPFIVRWPAVTKPGSVCDQLVQQADVMATLAEIFGVKLADNAGEDSFSFLPLLRGSDEPIRTSAVNCTGAPAIRQGEWKLILGKQPQLYNLANDLGETTNLAGQERELVAQMSNLLAKLVADGRSTPGEPQQNDVPVKWHQSR